MVTPAAMTSTQPRMSLPSIPAPAWWICMSPSTTVSLVPAGTPVLPASGNPQPAGWGAQLDWCGLVPVDGAGAAPRVAGPDGAATGGEVVGGVGVLAEVGAG